MKYYLTLIISLTIYSQIFSQDAYRELVGDRVVAFYPENFDPVQTLPSFALMAEPDSIGEMPAAWEIIPEFYTEGTNHCARISFPETADLYGTGEVVGPLRRNGTEVEMWNTDSYGYNNSTRLYQSHPWIMGVRQDGTCFGILVDHTWRQKFFLNNPIEIISEGPPFRILVLERDTPQEMMQALGELTGTIALPPLWALGYHQCRYSYYPDTRVKEIADNFRQREIPCDVIWMDIDYMDGFRVFTFDPSGFPDPVGLNAYLHQQDFKSIWMIDPGVKKEAGYFVYDSGTENDIWVQDSDGDVYTGEVWPGECVFPDYTMPAAQTWWAGLYQDFMANGMDGIWNDMNEPAVFNTPEWTMPEDNIHRGGGSLPEDFHLRYHNVYGYLMVRSSREGIMDANPEKRPFVLTRANHLGGQRYAATWTGDNRSTFDHLQLSIPMSLTLGLSGQPFSGPDIGGFDGNCIPDLMGKWMAVGAFYPFCRNHTSTGTADQEPWSFGKTIEDVSRAALHRRYQLLPYLYTLFHESSQSGMPVMQPVFFADPADLSIREEQEAFMLGSDLMIVPAWADNPALPQGNWRTHRFEHESLHQDEYQAEVLQRDGSIIPVARPMQSTAGFHQDSITLIVSPDSLSMAVGHVYADAGEGWDYLNGAYLISRYNCVPKGPDSLLVTIEDTEGHFNIPGRVHRVGVLAEYAAFYSAWTEDTAIIVPAPRDINVDLIRPADGDQFAEGADIFVQAEVETEMEIQQVIFYADGEPISQLADPPYETWWTDVSTGMYSLYAEVVIDNDLSVATDEITVLVGEFGTGQILHQVWRDLPGYQIPDLTLAPDYPQNPDENNYLGSFKTAIDTDDFYGARIIGFIHPPKTGDYTFWIAGDDYCELWLSTDSSFANRQMIAEVPGWSFPDEFEKYAEQSSTTISLAAGEKYCVMALQKEDQGGDFVQVAWDIPGEPRAVIDGVFLSPYDQDAAGVGDLLANRVNMYPNPTNGQLTISVKDYDTSLEIFDVTGNTIFGALPLQADKQLKLQTLDWNPGIYFVRIKSKMGLKVLKLVVN